MASGPANMHVSLPMQLWLKPGKSLHEVVTSNANTWLTPWKLQTCLFSSTQTVVVVVVVVIMQLLLYNGNADNACRAILFHRARQPTKNSEPVIHRSLEAREALFHTELQEGRGGS